MMPILILGYLRELKKKGIDLWRQGMEIFSCTDLKYLYFSYLNLLIIYLVWKYLEIKKWALLKHDFLILIITLAEFIEVNILLTNSYLGAHGPKLGKIGNRKSSSLKIQ
jgi:hypothetical protein